MSDFITRAILDADPYLGPLKEMQEQTIDFQDTTKKASTESQKAFSEASKSTKQFNDQIKKGAQDFVGAADKRKQAYQAEIALLKKLREESKNAYTVKEIEEYNKKIAETKKNIQTLQSAMDDTGKKANNLSGIMQKVAGFIVAAFAIDKILEFGKAIVNATINYQKFTASLNALLKSRKESDRLNSQITAFAATTPFELPQVQEGTKKLLAFNIASSQIVSTLKRLGNVASGIDVPLEELAEIYGKINVQGRVFAEDINQLTGRGIPIIQELAKQFGVTDGEVKKLVEDGKVGFAQIEEAFKSMSSEGGLFFGQMDEQSKQLGGQVSNLSDKFYQLYVTIGKGTGGILNYAVEKIGQYVDFVTFALKSTKDIETDLINTKINRDFEVYQENPDELRQIRRENMVREIEKQERELNNIYADYGDERSDEERAKDIEGREFKLRFYKEELETYAKYERDLKATAKKAAEAKAAEQKAIDEKARKEAEKEAKRKAKEQAAQLKLLMAELADLERKAQDARLKLLKQNSAEYFEAQLQNQLTEIDQIQKKLEEQSKKAGKGGTLGEKQMQQLGLLREVAYKEYGDELNELQKKNDDDLFNLQAKSNEKEIEEIKRKYAKRLDEVRRGSEIEKALIAAREREIAILTTKQGLDTLGQEEDIAIAGVERTLIASDDDPARFERYKQQAILDIQIAFAKKRLQLLEASGMAEDKVQIEQLKTTIAKLQGERGKLADRKEPFSLDALFGFKDGTFADLEQKTGIISNSIKQVMSAEIEANEERINSLNDYISEKSDELNQELELNKQGFASNVEGKRDELAQLKKQREQALADQRKAQKAQNAIDTATQAGAIITASANILKGFSTIPLIGQILGIAAIAAMVGSFIATKAKVNAVTKMREGGLLEGSSHENGGIRGTGYFDDIEVEGGEFVTKKKQTSKYRDLLEAINEDDFSGLSLRNRSLNHLLDEIGISPAPQVAGQVTATHTQIFTISTIKMEAELRNINAKLDSLSNLEKIEKHTSNIPEEQVIQTDEGLLTISKRGRKVVKKQ